MAFNNLQPASGPFWIAPGGSVDIIMWYGNPGTDNGAQWIMAHPIAGQPPTQLQVSNFRKILDYSLGIITQNGSAQYSYDPNSAYYRYRATVTNLGSQGVFFNIQGGGNV
jgi:hypothetical protein